jgi:hypothetical protein
MKLKSTLITALVMLAWIPVKAGEIHGVPGVPPPPPPTIDPLVTIVLALVSIFT